MNKFDEFAGAFICGLWGMIILFVTFPLWGLPYIIYSRWKNRKN